ncbi:hypothetical protein GW17_00033594 [Ensete ventricosum]|nr:hypothetical protein GW17_00033594 [Ensete ventricosum]RZR83235.1 hypothetical protein BHM03_00009815 [Ensete ventricosum]
MSLRDGMMQPHDSDKHERSSCTSNKNDNLDMPRTSDGSTDKDADIVLCRVCHCSECDRRGDAALSFLNIVPPSQEYLESNVDGDSSDKLPRECTLKGVNNNKTSQEQKEFVEFVGPEGEIFVCSADVESGSYFHQDTLIDLGCSCKNDLAQVHYACALKWFVSHGSTVCEICGSVAKNVRVTDFRKVMASLKDYEELRNRTVTGEFAYAHVGMNSGVDPDAVAAIRRQRLSEISLWFSSHGNSATVSQEALEEFPYNPTENVVNMETQMTKWALEGTGILVAIGLVSVILTWFIASHVGKFGFVMQKAARYGFNILLGGVCALVVLIFPRFVSRILFHVLWFFEQDSSMHQHASGQSHLYFGFLPLQYGPLGPETFDPHDNVA